jgi:Fur family ferric uptake transcriptional regulator
MEKKSRKTRQKELITSELSKFPSFFTADQLYEKIKKKDDSIGIATVYRLLKDIRKKKVLHSYICERKMIYSQDKNNHCHFVCQKCGIVTHFNVEKIDFFRSKIKGDVCHFQIDVYGTCDKCLKNEKF